MNIPYRSHLVVAGAVLLCCWTLFGQDRARTNPAGTSAERFQIASSNGSIILLETQTGQTWTYVDTTAVTTLPVWIPIQRLDSREEVDKWKKNLEQSSPTKTQTPVPRRYDDDRAPPQPIPKSSPPPSRIVPFPDDNP
jgi:hypothetical protein